jgi:hypothetical protein
MPDQDLQLVINFLDNGCVMKTEDERLVVGRQ